MSMREGKARSALWHPFADMGAVESNPLVLVRGEGSWIWDADGRRYLDATAGLWYSNLGHGRADLVEVASEQMRTLDAYSTFGDFANPPALELADRIAGLTGRPGTKVFLSSGGGDAIETAAKIARAYHVQNGEPSRAHFLGRTFGYHGTHGIGTSIGGISANAEGFGPLVSSRSSVAFGDPAALEIEIERLGAERVAAFFCEPVIGAGGVRHPPPGYIEAVAVVCRRNGVLFVADCVISAFGRLGTWFGIDRWTVEPDLIALAKGISAGVLPVGATVVAPHVAAPFFTGRAGAPVLRHGPTYAGHPVCCAVANKVLDIYEAEDLIPRGRELEKPLADVLEPLDRHPLVGEVRAGLGLLAGIDLKPEALEQRPGAVVEWSLAVRERGVFVRPLGTGVALSPPLTVTSDELALIGESLLAGLKAIEPVMA